MTKNSPRIYVYKITFDEVDHYYYGSHKEKHYNQYYMGSPVTHKDYWKLYTPKKEYIKFFDFSDSGYSEAREYENSLIRPVYNIDPLCLNESCGGHMSLDVCRNSAKIMGQKAYKLGIGIHGLPKEIRIKNAKLAGQKCYELGVGVHARSKEEMSEHGKKGAKVLFELGIGIYGQTREEKSGAGKKGGKIAGYKTYELGVGIHGMTQEERIEASQRGAKTQHTQKWQCTVTGYVSSPCGLSSYQKARGIDTSSRIRIK